LRKACLNSAADHDGHSPVEPPTLSNQKVAFTLDELGQLDDAGSKHEAMTKSASASTAERSWAEPSRPSVESRT
jgi:hypothetical protein